MPDSGSKVWALQLDESSVGTYRLALAASPDLYAK